MNPVALAWAHRQSYWISLKRVRPLDWQARKGSFDLLVPGKPSRTKRILPAFGEIGSAVDALNQFRDTPFGKVRINAPNSVAPFVFRSVIGPLIAKNPGLQLEIVATDRLVDIVEEGFDAGIRLGESLRDGMTAVKIKPRLRFAVVGSSSYFEHRPLPKTPEDLRHHVCIRNIYPSGKPYAWEFSRAGKIIEFEPTGSLSLDDHELMVEAALSGVGLAYVWEERARPHIENGSLVECLASWSAPGGHRLRDGKQTFD